MSTLTLSGDYGYEYYKVSGLADGTLIDATNASWFQDNDDSDGASSPYPFRVYDAPGVVLDGGTIDGNIDQTADWRTVYDLGNSAGVRIEDSPDAVIRNWSISDSWDAIRIGWNSDNFLIEDVWLTNIRDDAIENDRLLSGTIRDSLFDGVFSGISIAPSSSSAVDGSNEVITIDGVLIRLQPYLYKGEMTHRSIFKTDSGTDGAITPSLRITNSVFAIEVVDHASYRSMFDAWDHTIESSGNYFLNLSDTPLPADYPMPPAGWTVLQGQEARDFWEQARNTWISDHGGDVAPPADDNPPPDDDPPVDDNPPVDDSDGATFDGENYEGTKRDDLIIGNDLDNNIVGDNGNDTIMGGAGDDTIQGNNGIDLLWGNAGQDVFFFGQHSDSSESRGIDIIMDFQPGDRIDLSAIDADRTRSGDQAFRVAEGSTAGKGELHISYDPASGYTMIEGNINNGPEAEIVILLKGEIALTEGDFLF